MLCLTSCSDWMGVYTLPSFIPLWRHRSALSIHTTQSNTGKSGQRCRKSPGKQRERVKGLTDVWHISVHEWLFYAGACVWAPLTMGAPTEKVLHNQEGHYHPTHTVILLVGGLSLPFRTRKTGSQHVCHRSCHQLRNQIIVQPKAHLPSYFPGSKLTSHPPCFTFAAFSYTMDNIQVFVIYQPHMNICLIQ